MENDIPIVKYCHIGGSGTWELDYPEDLRNPYIRVVRDHMIFQTPYGESAPFKLIELSGEVNKDGKPRQFFYVTFHGWRGLSPYDKCPEERVFWVLQQAQVKYIIADGSVGCVNSLLKPGDVIIPSDFIDYTKRHYNVGWFTQDIVEMKEIVCPALKKIMEEKAEEYFRRVFSTGVYGVYEAPRIESAAETRRFIMDGCDVIGHTFMPEAMLAIAIGACYVGFYLVSDYAEGLHPNEVPLDEALEEYSEKMANVMLYAMAEIDSESMECNCTNHVIHLSENVLKRIGR